MRKDSAFRVKFRVYKGFRTLGVLSSGTYNDIMEVSFDRSQDEGTSEPDMGMETPEGVQMSSIPIDVRRGSISFCAALIHRFPSVKINGQGFVPSALLQSQNLKK